MLPFVLLVALQLAASTTAAPLLVTSDLLNSSNALESRRERIPFWQRPKNGTPDQEPQSILEPEPEPEPEVVREPEVVEDPGVKNDFRKEHTEDGDTTSVSAGNQVIMYNGKPVVIDHKPVGQEAPAQPSGGVERRNLRNKLGLNFLDADDADEDDFKGALDSPMVGYSGAFKKDFDNQEMTDDAVDASGPLREPEPEPEPEEDPAVLEQKALGVVKETPIDISNVETTEKKAGGSFVLYNGKPMSAQNKPKDFNRFIPGGLLKRDMKGMMGGMFPKKKGVVRPEDEEKERVHDGTNEAINTAAEPAPAPAPEPVEEPEEVGQTQVKVDPAAGGSFVVYNGIPVEVNGKITKPPKVKKPKFHKDEDDGFILDKRAAVVSPEPGHQIKGLNPFSANPISGNSNTSSNESKEGKNVGDTFSAALVEQAFIAPVGGTFEDEIVNVDVGENYVLYNGKPQRQLEGGPNIEIASLREGFF